MHTPDKNILWAGTVALAVILGAWYLSSLGYGDAGVPTPVAKNAPREIERVPVRANGEPFLGRKDAPVTLIEFADFQCPSCATFHFGAGSVIMDEYVKRGLVKFVYRDFPLLGEESFLAAYGAQCARAQGKFWEYHDYLFAQQTRTAVENDGVFSRANLVQYAHTVGLAKDAFADCVRLETYKDEVARDIQDGKQAGVTGTPTVFINGRKLEGALTFAEYQKVIEEELKKNF